MSPTLLFATRNPHKKALFAPVFAGHGIRCLTLYDAGLAQRAVPETGRTPEENALLKARAYHGERWPLVFGDDAGLEVDALGGEPGVQVRRWNGRFQDDVDDETWLAYLLHRLKGVPQARRTARWVAAWVVIAPDENEYVHHVAHEFTIAERPLRPILPGSPMSAVELHQEDHLSYRQAWIAAQWAEWGLLDRIARWR
ncbi:MAG: non-canonical purine NTP pyrophosphatase [Anaerolineae bacterium]